MNHLAPTAADTPADPPPHDGPLRRKIHAWRMGGNATGKKMKLQDARQLLGISIGYISDLENGNEPISRAVFRKYHAADPVYFPLADAGLLI